MYVVKEQFQDFLFSGICPLTNKAILKRYADFNQDEILALIEVYHKGNFFKKEINVIKNESNGEPEHSEEVQEPTTRKHRPSKREH